MVYILIGGTFDGLHKGHREFISKAFVLGDNVLICLTSDEMARKKPLSDKIEPYDRRKERLEEFLGSGGWLGKTEIVKIHDPFTEGMRPELTHIVFSHETAKNAEKINAMRKENGLKELGIIEIRWVLGDDGKPISDVRIRKGEIDKEGHVQ
jgi:pantetheine-phosphate adenylyltransferase